MNTIRIFAILGLCIGLVSAARADLTPTDANSLTQHLNIIAADPDWPQASVNAANDILSKPAYGSNDWESYFQTYFSNHVFTERLLNYLQYPVFHWFDEPMHLRLQRGLTGPLLNLKATAKWNTAVSAPANTFATNGGLREDLFTTQQMLIQLTESRTLLAAPEVRNQIFQSYTNLIQQHASLLRAEVSLDRQARPYWGVMRAQAHLVLLGAAPTEDLSRPAFSAGTRDQVRTTLGLTGTLADIWNEHSLLLLENNLSSPAQRRQVQQYLSLIPPQMHNTASITIDEFLGNSEAYQPTRLFTSRPYDGVNIFETEIGGHAENSFPADVEPGNIDLFTAALAHEINHVVDVVSVQENPALAARRQALLDAAGNEQMNYLRSMFEDGFFQNAPQEFFASISNQWFTDSGKTLQLGLTRFDTGRGQPLDQAIFFADVYARGTDTTWFYRIDATGNMERWSVPLQRDGAGRITELISQDKRYRFTRDATGNIVAYNVQLAADFNGNGVLDAGDFTVWRDSQGRSGAGLAADGNGDRLVDLDDYELWRAAFMSPGGAGAAAAPLAVPEPTAGLAMLAMAAAMRLGRSGRRVGTLLLLGLAVGTGCSSREEPTGASASGTATVSALDAQNPYSLPEEESAEALSDFIHEMSGHQPIGDTAAARGLDIRHSMEARLAAAEKLLQLPNLDAANREMAVGARLDSLRALAVVGPEGSERRFRDEAQKLIDGDDVGLKRLGSQYLLLMEVDLLGDGEIRNPEPVVNKVESLLKYPGLDVNVLSVVQHAALTLQKRGFEAEASETATALAAAYRDHANAELAQAATALAGQLPLVKFQDELEDVMRSSDGKFDGLMNHAQQLLSRPDPGRELLELMSHTSQMLEFSGNLAESRQIVDGIEGAYRNHADSELVQSAKETVEIARRRLGLIGQPLQIEGTHLDGTPFKWEDYAGKVVLIDFWATWCSPCLEEIPNIKRNYERFHKAGFDVVGINLDDQQADVAKFLEKKAVPWATVVTADSTVRGFENVNAVRCGVQSIPFLILVDRDGKVAALHVRGDRLTSELESRFGSQPAASVGS